MTKSEKELQELQNNIKEWRSNYLLHWSKLELPESEFAEYLLHQFDAQFNINENVRKTI